MSLAGTIGPRHLQQEILRIPPGLLSLQAERLEHDESPAELVIDDTIENGFDENCDNIEIGESNGDTIEIFVNNNEVVAGEEVVTTAAPCSPSGTFRWS